MMIKKKLFSFSKSKKKFQSKKLKHLDFDSLLNENKLFGPSSWSGLFKKL